MIDETLTYNSAYFMRFKNIDETTSMRYINNYILPNFHDIMKESVEYLAIEEDENGQDAMVLFISHSILNNLIQFCKEEELIVEHYDISVGILRSEIPAVVMKMMNSDEFRFHFDKFNQKHLTVDLVLDKILIHGKESLNEIDKKTLKDGI